MNRNQWTRRKFIRTSAAAVLGWHAALRSAAPPAGVQDKAPAGGRFTFLKLDATRLDDMRRFYTGTLNLPLHAETADSLTVRFGDTLIEFTAARGKQEPFYHFAFNVPEKKFPGAKAWLAKRCPLLRDSRSGDDELFFRFWNAHAVYFQDPSGNIGELIARHTLPSTAQGPFDVDDILYASEIGLVSRDPGALAGTIAQEFGLKPYPNDFFMGDERGMFVLPAVGRPWIPQRRQEAEIFPAEVHMIGHGSRELRPLELPYVIRRKA